MLTTLKKSVSNASTEGTGATTSTSALKTRTQKTPAVKTKPNKKTTSPTKPPSTASVKSKKTTKVAKPATKTKATSSVKSKPVVTKQSAKVNVTGKTRLSQYKSKGKIPKKSLPRLRREKVPETNFALRYFPWSSWKLVISSEERKNLVPTIQRIGNKDKVIEYSMLDIFKGKTKCPALYEFAVTPRGSNRKRVVYAKFCPGFSSYSAVWWKVLFPTSSLRKQVDNIVRKQGGDIFVRRLVLKKYQSYKDIPSIVKNYDYVWVPEDGAKKYRELKQDSYVVSEEMEVD